MYDSKLTDEILDRIIAAWQPLSRIPLTREDARQITMNLTTYFSILLDWHRSATAAAPRHGEVA